MREKNTYVNIKDTKFAEGDLSGQVKKKKLCHR